MRDTRKDSAYFTRFLAYATAQVEKRETMLRECSDEAKKQRILVPLCTGKMQLLVASYSAGASSAELRRMLTDAVSSFTCKSSISYEDLLILTSFGVCLKQPDAVRKLSAAFPAKFAEDALLHGFYTGVVDRRAQWGESFAYPEYEALGRVVSAETKADKTQLLLAYLDGWYDARKDRAWYGSDARDSETYCGYWAFEAAAAAALCGVDPAALKQNVYYPVF